MQARRFWIIARSSLSSSLPLDTLGRPFWVGVKRGHELRATWRSGERRGDEVRIGRFPVHLWVACASYRWTRAWGGAWRTWAREVVGSKRLRHQRPQGHGEEQQKECTQSIHQRVWGSKTSPWIRRCLCRGSNIGWGRVRSSRMRRNHVIKEGRLGEVIKTNKTPYS